jgi:hypothetical protein
MEAQPPETKPFELMPAKYRYYDYEFERYWHFFQVFGRVGYNPNTSSEVWRREFEKRFGKEAAPFIEAGLHRASWVLPRIVASCYPYSYFPMTRGWAEKQRLGDLPIYARADGSDIQQFANFDEEAQMLIEGGDTAKVRPGENSRWFEECAAEINRQIVAAEKRIGENRNKEFDSTMADLKILSNLALYHSRRIPAAVSYRLFERTRNAKALEDAIVYERRAVEAWRQLVTAAGDFYTADLQMGVRGANLCGHWKDELAALEKGIDGLERQLHETSIATLATLAPRYRAAESATEAPMVTHQAVINAPAEKPLTIQAEVRAPSGVKWVRLRYRSANQHQDYHVLSMLPMGEKDRYQAVIPAEHVVSKWDLMYFIETMDNHDHGRIYPDLNKETPYIVVKLVR